MDKIWIFHRDYLRKCSKMKPIEVLNYLEDYKRSLSFKLESKDFIEPQKNSILISMKIHEDFLIDFKNECAKHNVKYQTQIKNLMRAWLSKK